MAKNDKMDTPQERKALAQLRRLGSLEEVLNSGASLEIRAACIEMEIKGRRRLARGQERDR